MRKPRFKSIESAVKRLEQYKAAFKDACQRAKDAMADAKLMARLAADGPCFDNPLEAMAAKNRRDELLAIQGLRPDGKHIGIGAVLRKESVKS
ncbi:MAG TPA: hypothetical protein VD994_07605 [Prosthecobacter sp.]|nr:hypothetical protein [Prosthecobacter sp.]